MRYALLALALLAAPPEDPERAAAAAYRAGDKAGFLTQMRAAAAREPDLPRVLYNLACAEAQAGSPEAAVADLRRLAQMGLAFALERDDDLAPLRARPDFQAVARAMADNRQPRGQAKEAFTLAERGLLAEGVAFDPRTGRTLVGSARRRKVVAVGPDGAQRDLVGPAQDGLGAAMGLAADPARRTLWVASAALPHMDGYQPGDDRASGLFAFDLDTGKLKARHPLPRDGKPRAPGDLTVSSAGEVYATDSLAPAVYRLGPGGEVEVLLEGPFRSLQGVAVSADGKALYLADYALGLFRLELAGKALSRLELAPGVAAVGIDGLYQHQGRLLATQNGIEPRRVVSLSLDPTGRKVTAARVLLAADPRADDLSLAAVAGDALLLNAKSGWAGYGDDGKPRTAEPPPPHLFLRVPLKE